MKSLELHTRRATCNHLSHRAPLVHTVAHRGAPCLQAVTSVSRLATICAMVMIAGCARPHTGTSSADTSDSAVLSHPSPDNPRGWKPIGNGQPHIGVTPSLVEQPADLQLFPYIRASKALDRLEVDARVSPMLVPDARTPLFYLETICCSPDTREHESLLVSDAKPSHVHAALLAMGLTPGKPGAWEVKDKQLVAIQPSGDRVMITFRFTTSTNGDTRQIDVSPVEWITSVKNAQSDSNANNSIVGTLPTGTSVHWVFAGSHFVQQRAEPRPAKTDLDAAATPAPPPPAASNYDADGTGQIIGLHTFGSEVLAWPVNLNPDANALEPEWVAKMDATPPAGSPVTIIIRKAK